MDNALAATVQKPTYRIKCQLLKALVMVASGSTEHVKCSAVVWDLVKLGLERRALQYQLSTLSVSLVNPSVAVVMNLLAVLSNGNSLGLAFLKRVGASVHSFLKSSTDYLLEQLVVEFVCGQLVSHWTFGRGTVVHALMDMGLSCFPVQGFSLLERILLENPWEQKLFNLPHAMPVIFAEHDVDLKLLNSLTPSDIEVVDAWACVLRAAPWAVIKAWMRGGCNKHPSWFAEAVLLRLLGLPHAGTCENDVECMQAVYASMVIRSLSADVSGTGPVWADLAARAVTKTWTSHSHSEAYVAAAMDLLGGAVYLSSVIFVREPQVVDFVQQAFRTMPPSRGAVLCARNGLVSLADTPAALPGFQAAVKTFVTSMAGNGFAGLRPLPRSVLVDFVWALRFLQYGTPASVDEDMASGLFALRALHTLVHHVPLDMQHRDVLTTVNDVLLKLPATLDPRHASLVLQIVVCMYSSHVAALQYGTLGGEWDVQVMACARLLNHFADQLRGATADRDLKEACVHPRDHGWNVRLFCLLQRFCRMSTAWTEWVYRLIPSISSRASIPTVSDYFVFLTVDCQLVRKGCVFFGIYFPKINNNNICVCCLRAQAKVSMNCSALRTAWMAAVVDEAETA